jgi:hypothetical protein
VKWIIFCDEISERFWTGFICIEGGIYSPVYNNDVMKNHACQSAALLLPLSSFVQGCWSQTSAYSVRFVRNVIYSVVDEEVPVRFFHTLWHKFDTTVLTLYYHDCLRLHEHNFAFKLLLFLCRSFKEFISSLIVNSYYNLYVYKIGSNKYFWHSKQTNSIFVFLLFVLHIYINKVRWPYHCPHNEGHWGH